MKILVTIILILTVSAATAQYSSTDTLKYCLNREYVGVGGFDPVSYFKSDKPVAGSTSISAHHDGVEYRFASQGDKLEFINNPLKYLPQFGGWCSMTLVMGRATTPKYDNFTIQAGKLYLFERTLSVNGRELWLKDIKGNEEIAVKNYNSYKSTGRIQ